MDRGGPAHDRLYEEAKWKEERRQMLKEELVRQALCDADTGKPLFRPNVSGRREPGSGWDPEEDSFATYASSRLSPSGHDYGMPNTTSRRSVEELVSDLFPKEPASKVRPQDESLRECTFQPYISPYSEYIVSKKGKKPLYSPPSKHLSPSPNRSFETDSGSYANSSQSSIMNRALAEEFERRMQTHLRRKEERVRLLQDEQDAKALTECTFAPKLCRRSQELFTTAQASARTIMSDGESPRERPAASSRHQQSPMVGSHRHRSQSEEPNPIDLFSTDPEFSSPLYHGSPYVSAHLEAERAPQPSSSSKLFSRPNVSAAAAAAAAAPRESEEGKRRDADFMKQMQELDECITSFERDMTAALDEWCSSQPAFAPRVN
eukprot:NODE_521_length_2150_cov_27.505474_g479_i0.p1 GENE.NODE_521_length_2150_cov_27.505474_g479_i0~~NODE_521_length_2150_cov_27.505474_g479_i0.p1  ORF type:complete len:377 (-),score=55.28 NODE_521_length_2150_cov_27.505474_g479_i0:136-1266(-)